MRDDQDSDERYQISKNDEETVTDVIEVLRLGKLSSQKNIYNVEKESDKRNRMDIIDDEEYYERDQTEESKEDDLESQELETDERDYIENPESCKMIDSQKNRENDDPIDTDIEMETNVVKIHRIKYF